MLPFLAALIPALVGGAASVGGALITSNAANKATAATNAATAKADAYGAPYREAGAGAVANLEAAYGLGPADTLDARRNALTTNFEDSPLYRYTYQPAIDEATKAVNASGSANGRLDSGRTIKAIQDRAARIGGQTFGNYLGGMDAIAARGQNAAFNSGSNVVRGAEAGNESRMSGADSWAGGLAGVAKAVGTGFDAYNFNKNQSAYGPNGLQKFNAGYPIY